MPEVTGGLTPLFHVDRMLTNLSIRASQPGFVSDALLPVFEVDDPSDTYPVYGKENFRRRQDLRSPGSESKRSRWTVDASNKYNCVGHSLKDFVPRDIKADPPLDLLNGTTALLTEQIRLGREMDCRDQLTTDLTAASRYSDLTAAKWSSNANNPISVMRADITAIGKRCGKRPNTLVIGAPSWDTIVNNSNVYALVTGAKKVEAALIKPEQIATLLRIDKVIVADCLYDTAAEGQTASLDYVWAKLAVLAYVDPNPGLMSMTLGLTFRWRNALNTLAGKEMASQIPGATAQFVERYYWQPNKADVVEVHEYRDTKTIAADAAVMYDNIY